MRAGRKENWLDVSWGKRGMDDSLFRGKKEDCIVLFAEFIRI